MLLCGIVVTVFVLQSSLSSFLPAPPQPPNAFPNTRAHELESESQCMSSCVCVFFIKPACLRRLERRLLFIVDTGKSRRRRLGVYIVDTGKSKRAKERLEV